MAKPKEKHPIRRVRDAIKSAPEKLNLRKYSTAAGFANLIGRSASHVRNVECGSIKSWEQLAHQIERRTKVSSKWLLSRPSLESPVLDVRGEPWSPELYLDRLGPREDMLDWRYLLERNPSAIPEILSQILRARIVIELSLGYQDGIENMVPWFDRMGFFHSPALKNEAQYALSRQSDNMVKRAMNPIGVSVPSSKEDSPIIYGIRLEDATVDDLAMILEREGFGWASNLPNLPANGLLADAKKFFTQKYRLQNSNLEDDDD